MFIFQFFSCGWRSRFLLQASEKSCWISTTWRRCQELSEVAVLISVNRSRARTRLETTSQHRLCAKWVIVGSPWNLRPRRVGFCESSRVPRCPQYSAECFWNNEDACQIRLPKTCCSAHTIPTDLVMFVQNDFYGEKVFGSRVVRILVPRHPFSCCRWGLSH